MEDALVIVLAGGAGAEAREEVSSFAVFGFQPERDLEIGLGLCVAPNLIEDSGALEVQDEFTVSVDELRSVHRGTLAAAFGAVVGQ